MPPYPLADIPTGANPMTFPSPSGEKSQKKLFLPLVLLFLLLSSLSAATLPDLRPWPHEGSDLPLHPALITGRLENGFRYVLVPHRNPGRKISLHLDVQAGSFHERSDQRGIAHFLEHMAFNGSTHFPPGTLIHYFQEIGMDFGGDTNAHTSLYETVYDLSLPEGTGEYLDKGFLVLADYAGGLLLTDAEIDRERGVILSEKRSRDSGAYRSGQAINRFLFPGMRFTERSPIGEEDVIEKADRKVFLDFYNAWYRPENMILVMTGNFETEEALALIKKRFSGLKSRPDRVETPDAGSFSHQGDRFFHHENREAGQMTLSIVTAAPVPLEGDSLASRKKALLRDLSHNILNYRLVDRLATDPKTPYDQAAAFTQDLQEGIRATYLVTTSSPEHWQESLAAMEQMLRQALQQGFTKEEVERIRMETLETLDKRIATFPTEDNKKLARSILRSLNSAKVFTSAEDEKRLLRDFIGDLSPEVLHQTFMEAWGRDHRLVVMTGNTGLSDEKALQLMEKTWRESLQVDSMKREKEEKLVFPYLKKPKKIVKPLEDRWVEDLEFRTLLFPNQTRLHIKKTDFETDMVRMVLSFGKGRAFEPESFPGISFAAENLINLSGTGKLNAAALDRLFAGKSISLNFSIRDKTLAFSGSARKDEIPLLLDLIRHKLTDPAFRPESWLLAKRWAEQEDREALTQAGTSMRENAFYFFTDSDPRFMRPRSTEMTEKMRLAAEAWLSPMFREAPLEISMVGDLEPDLVIAEVGRYLGTLPRKKMKEKAMRPLTFLSGAKATVPVTSAIPFAEVQIAYPTTDTRQLRDARGLALVAEILSNRIREEIREKEGLAYSPGSYHAASSIYEGFGALYIASGAKPDDAEKIRKIAMTMTENLKSGISEKEVQRAKEPLLSGIRENFQKNPFWLFRVLDGSAEDPDQLDRIRTLEKGYEDFSAEELTNLARKWLIREKASSIAVLPVGGM